MCRLQRSSHGLPRQVDHTVSRIVNLGSIGVTGFSAISQIKAIMDRFGVHTKTDAVDLALRHLAGQPCAGRRHWRCAGRAPSARSRRMWRRRRASRDTRGQLRVGGVGQGDG